MLTLLALLGSAGALEPQEDPYLWLEGVTDEAALAWVRERNTAATDAITADPGFADLQARLRTILDSDDRIPYVSQRGDHLYNFWRDGEHPKGLWRRTTLASYRTDSPEWEVVLDLDALASEEDEAWVWKGSTCLPPEYRKCLLSLSRGGADATVTREFDAVDKRFIDGGFTLPEAKGDVSWIDADTLFVATDFGEGSLTESGYPRVVKTWTRGTPLESAEVVFEAEASDISAGAYRDHSPGFERDFIWRGLTFYTNELYTRWKGEWVKIDKPDGASAGVHREWITFELRDDWELGGTTYAAGSLLVAPFDKWMKGKRDVEVLFAPTERTSLSGVTKTRGHIVLNMLDTVKNRLEVVTPGKKGWTRAPLKGVPANGSVNVWAVDADESDAVWISASDYITPSLLALGTIGGEAPEVLKTLPAQYDASGLVISQHMATSEDGTKIPYFQVSRGEVTEASPTLLYGYGGFEVSLLPYYSGEVGTAWLEKGGVYVVANIRGGGEFGPRWHQAALKEKRHRAYEDFAAVAKDLVTRGVTTTDTLGAKGGSNGGLLMGNMYTLYPELFGAIVCQVPLLDMRRYHTLLAGASWMGEYGDPDDPAQWEYIRTFSPYHNIDAERDTPPMLITTSTRDDRVHPGHARKMAARLLEVGKTPLYYENIEGGHGGAANNEQRAFMTALAYSFLWQQLAGETDAGE
ncbi:MAG: prolyl oligopeptidase [Myxococcota bacterium]|jgi:prolyl oligopeptidase